MLVFVRRAFLLAVCFLLAPFPAPGRAHAHNHDDDHQILCRNCGHTVGLTSSYVEVPEDYAERRVYKGSTPAPQIGEHAVLHNFGVGSSHAKGFQVATFSTLEDYKADKKFEPRSAFFPEYSWKAVMCPHCNVQIGWLFQETGTVEKSAGTASPKSKHRIKSSDGDLSSMHQRCLFFPQGYWTVRICHELSITQFHMTPQGQKDPEYSLGSYDSSSERVISGVYDALARR